MARVVALGHRVLPRGWRDFGLQLGIWFGFYFTYLAVRHLTDRDASKAVVNGLRVISLEQHLTHHLFELSMERIAGWCVVRTSRTIGAKGRWALWPVWVWFCVIATANHYVLDVLAGIGVAVAALLATTWAPRLFARLRAAGPTIANLL